MSPDAAGAAPGLFEAADGGTLFLHDVDALSLEVQGKVLAAIDSGSVRRLGGGDARPLDVRVIAATHADLADLARRGMFRADLLDRFAAVSNASGGATHHCSHSSNPIYAGMSRT